MLPAMSAIGRTLLRGPIAVLVLAMLACQPVASVPPEEPTPAPPTPVTDEPHPPEEEPGPTISHAGSFPAAVHGMAIDAEGRLYLSDSFNTLGTSSQIYRQDPPHTHDPRPTALPVTQPAGLEFFDDHLLVCDLGGHQVTRYDRELEPTQTWAIQTPWNVGRSASGELLVVTYDGRLLRLGPDDTTEILVEGLAAPFDLAPTPEGPVWISEQGSAPGEAGRVALWTLDGEMVREIAHPWATPEGLALDPEGNLWIAETEGRQLLRASVDGEVEVMAEVEGLPVVIATMPSGDLLVSVTGPSPHLLRVRFPPPRSPASADPSPSATRAP